MPDDKEIVIHIYNESEIKIYLNNELIYESDVRVSPLYIIDGLLSSLGFNVGTMEINLPEDKLIEEDDNEPWYEEHFLDEMEE